jgi:hypothetical protein
MKKLSTLFFAGLIFSFSLSSCHKCMECEFEEEHGNHTHDNHDKKCGSRAELKDFEEKMQEEAKAKGTTAKCHDAHNH